MMEKETERDIAMIAGVLCCFAGATLILGGVQLGAYLVIAGVFIMLGVAGSIAMRLM